MDTSQFLRVVIGNLAIKFPGSDPSSPCYCKIKFPNLAPQSSTVTILPQHATHPDPSAPPVSACFTLSKPDVQKLITSRTNNNATTSLRISIYHENGGSTGCYRGLGTKLLGRVSVPLEINTNVLEGKMSAVVQNGWVMVGGKKKNGSNPEMYLSVKVQPDPRFVFEFDGEPECSPQVYQVKGNVKQPVFTCKFSCRQSVDWNNSRSSSEPSTSRSWLSTLKVGDKDNNSQQRLVKERKGWSITIHDLSGSPVAAASMVTPFVPSQGSDQVSRSNPGAWLILRPGDGTWKPWGRLESWRDSVGPGLDKVGHKLELIPDADIMTGSVMGPAGVTVAHGSIPAKAGGKFAIDIMSGPSPSTSPNSSIDFSSWTGSGSGSTTRSRSRSSSGSDPGPMIYPGIVYRGFVMSSSVGGEGKESRPEVEIGAQHVTCTEDAAVFVALAAAMDLSMDACRPFSQKLRKELRQNSGDFVV
ncbi:hypothetical protein vseg_012938 [Gypsophila vaccaria]